MRVFYSGLFYLLIPFILLRLLWRSIKAPVYRRRWLERFAIYTQPFPKDVIWVHTVSVGEAEAFFPLARQLQRQHPDAKLLITTTTPTGSARVKAVMNDSVIHVYLPYDLPDAVNRFIQCFKPKLAIIMETEIWPNLFSSCGKNNIPLYIINARLSEKSSLKYQKISSLITPALANVKLIATQTQDDANNFIAAGAIKEKVKTLGNIKFDIEVPTELIKQGLQLKTELFGNRFVWLCASTHKNEETVLLQIYQALKHRIPNLLLIIAPRQAHRFSIVKKLAEQHPLNIVTRTSREACNESTDVYLADTIGELKMLYAASDVTFVGGSLVPKGGHNILEAAAVGVPVLFGPYMINFKEIAEEILKQDAAIQCHAKGDIIAALIALHDNPDYSSRLVEKGKLFVQRNQGAIDRICEVLSHDIA